MVPQTPGQRHRRIMFQGEGDQAIIGAHQPGEADAGTQISAASKKRGLLGAGVKVFGLEPG